MTTFNLAIHEPHLKLTNIIAWPIGMAVPRAGETLSWGSAPIIRSRVEQVDYEHSIMKTDGGITRIRVSATLVVRNEP